MRKLFLALLLLASPASAQDMIDLHQATVYNSPADIANWPITATITRVDMRSPAGLSFRFTAENSWPDYMPAGWTGPLQYTVWAVVNVNGRWATSGFIQMWKGRPSTGAPILSDFAANWAYDGRWGTMAGYSPHVGEQMGFFLSAGDARGQGGSTSLRERTNVVLVNLPGNDTGSFDFTAVTPIPVPTPLPVPTPVPQPVPSTTLDYTHALEEILQSQRMLLDTQNNLLAISKDTNSHVVSMDRTLTQTLGSISVFLGKYVAPAIGGYIIAKQMQGTPNAVTTTPALTK